MDNSMNELNAVVDLEGLEAEYARRIETEGYDAAVKSMESEAIKYINFQRQS